MSKKQEKFFGIEMTLWGGRRVRVTVTPEADDLIKQHKLSQAMVKTLAKSHAGYGIADVRSFKAFVKRGIYFEKTPGEYYLTDSGKKIVDAMFTKTILKKGIYD